MRSTRGDQNPWQVQSNRGQTTTQSSSDPWQPVAPTPTKTSRGHVGVLAAWATVIKCYSWGRLNNRNLFSQFQFHRLEVWDEGPGLEKEVARRSCLEQLQPHCSGRCNNITLQFSKGFHQQWPCSWHELYFSLLLSFFLISVGQLLTGHFSIPQRWMLHIALFPHQALQTCPACLVLSGGGK